MDHEKGPTLSSGDGYSASPPVVHYAAFCSTARLQYRLQICQPGCHGAQWSDRNVPIIKDISVFVLAPRNIFFKSVLSYTKGDPELNAANIFVAPQR